MDKRQIGEKIYYLYNELTKYREILNEIRACRDAVEAQKVRVLNNILNIKREICNLEVLYHSED